MTAELAHEPLDLDLGVVTIVTDSESARARAAQACETSAIAIARSELLRDRFEAARQTLAETTQDPLLEMMLGI